MFTLTNSHNKQQWVATYRHVTCIGPNQKNQPNLDLYLVRRYKICHFPLVVLYLCIGKNKKNQTSLVLYLVRRSKIFVSVTTLLLPFSAMCVTSLMRKSVYNLGKIVATSALTFGTCRRNISWWGRFGEITMRGNYSFGIWNRTTGLSKRNGAKIRELSLNFPSLADWLCNSRPRCRAALGRNFQRGAISFAPPCKHGTCIRSDWFPIRFALLLPFLWVQCSRTPAGLKNPTSLVNPARKSWMQFMRKSVYDMFQQWG